MMFSSNQKLEISGCIKHPAELSTALECALKLSNHLDTFTRTNKPSKCVYQITEDGRYCIGWAYEKIERGWNEYPFDFNLNIISQIIEQHLSKQPIEYGTWDGTYDKGFIMSAIPESMGDEDNGIKNPFFGIVEFRPYTCFYSK